MTTTPKVSIIENKRHETPDSIPSSQTVSTKSREKSGYLETAKDPWKAMTTPSDIGDMLDAMNGIEQAPYYRGPIDAISDYMIINDPTVNKDLIGTIELPYVPDLNDDLLKNIPRLADNIKPIIERYEALIKTYDELLHNARESLKYPMSPLEVQRIQKKIEIIKYNKGKLFKNYQEAKAVYDVQKAREEAAEESD